MTNIEQEYWSIPTADLLEQLSDRTGEQEKGQGLTSKEANIRLSKYGKNLLKSKKKTDSLSLLLAQFKTPIIIIFISTSGTIIFSRSNRGCFDHYFNRNRKRHTWVLARKRSYRCC